MSDTEGEQTHPEIEPYEGPAGGWGSLKSVGEILVREHVALTGGAIMLQQNKPGGFACVSCAWAKPAEPRTFEYCENGAKATAWELTTNRVAPDFFAQHTLSELESWSDYALEEAGRLTQPLRWDAASDRYLPVAWDEAFADIGARLKELDPRKVVLYASGRASLEASYMWQLFARLYGTNNLPDSSNMCHESTSVGLPESIGVPVGTVSLEDFDKTDCIIHIGQNVGTSTPRMLHQLQAAAKRDVPILVFNPLRERGLERFINPQSPVEMATGSETRIASHYYQVKNGGDIAALFGLAKALIAASDAGDSRALDCAFLAEHTHGFEAFAEAARRHDWHELERVSGLSRPQMEQAAALYARAERAMIVYGMGLTQHHAGVQNVHMVCNLALLRGNIGKPGAGICAVRGHSNVQGQRTVGITEKPELVPLDLLAEQYGFEPPRWKGFGTTETCEAVATGGIEAFVALGGNFIRAIPETVRMEQAWRSLPLTVQIATKLNRSHIIHGEVAYLLPCLGRIEIDEQASGPQTVSMEDSLAHIHGSLGRATPASEDLLSEPAIVARLAKATLPENRLVPWDAWVGDYRLIRRAIANSYPKIFKDYETQMSEPGGITRPVAARSRIWDTPTGKANFLTPDMLFAGMPDGRSGKGDDVLQLATLRSNDQFNTTIYGYHDRFRGVKGTRMVVFMNARDIARLGLAEGDAVTLSTAVDDGVTREVGGFRVTTYDLPADCCGAYFPECNPLVPLWHEDPKSKVPGYKAIPVRVRRDDARAAS